MSKREFLKKIAGQVAGSGFIPSEVEIGELLTGQVEDWIKPGSIPNLDAALGKPGKGLPCGRILEIYGPETQGKSTLLYYLLGQVQKQGGIAGLIDSELSFDKDWATILGVKADEVTVWPTIPEESSVEGFMDIVRDWVRAIRKEFPKEKIIIGWDTIWCTLTEELLALESFKDKKRIGSLARCMSQNLAAFHAFIAKEKVCMIFINQVRDNVGVMFGETEITPGGRALKHMASVRARVKRTSKLESGSQYGSVVNIKNKVSKPREKADFKIDQKKGFIKKPETKRK